MEITVLPPQPDEPQITARFAIQSLGEHAAGFLAANNLQGWPDDHDYVLRNDRIGDILLMLSATTGLYVGQAKRFAWLISKISEEAAAKIPRRASLDMVVKALGYFSYDVAYKCRSVDDFVQNFWPQGSAMGLQSLESQAPRTNANQRVINILLHHYQRNQEMDRKFNREALILKDTSLKNTREYKRIESLKRQIAEKEREDSRRPVEYRKDT
ncbi:hypothetical protein RBE51_17715 [Pseudomonas taiwanensis]|uniref:hypothetical protein n=1 Tax=Pseudomonas taiwanensis TaxID=470150 RepID=UPI0028DEACCA|nr:hypothetical protein [Pseudomonas taiwanensis]MDT8924648.1 hypothetical protein [Pseudomonas taiwanensis]